MRILFLGHQPENPSDAERGPRLRALLSNYTWPGTEIVLGYPDDFPGAKAITEMVGASTMTGLHHTLATNALIKKVAWAQDQGFDAVVQSNHFDPGVEASRWVAKIPVIGLMRAAVHVATTFSDRIGFLVPLGPHVPYTTRMLRTYGLERFIADMRPLGIYSSNMASQKQKIFDTSVEIMKAMVNEGGAEFIVPLGGALVPQVVSAADLAKEVGVPVTDNYGIGIHMAQMCVSMGLTHSPVAYPYTQVRYEDFAEMAY